MSTLPTMRAIGIPRYGGPEVLQACTMPVPVPAAGEVLVRVHAASVNRPDISYRTGIYDPPPGASRIPGLDAAGVVAATGAQVERWRVGDRVCGLTNGGGYAQFCVLPQGQCLPVPDGLSFEQAAALPETFFTAWANLYSADLGRLAHGERLLVQGGASGVGIASIQLARALRNACVVATAGSAEKRAYCRELGAAEAIDYADPAWCERARDAMPQGYDVILDSQGARYLAAHLRLLGIGGRLVLIATHGGTTGEVDLRDLMRRRLTITGSTLRPRSADFKAAVAQQLERVVWPLIAAGDVRMPIAQCFALDRAADAHRFLESGAGLGKVVLVVD